MPAAKVASGRRARTDGNTAAKAALRRKKQYEHSLEQTQGQIMTLEREIYNIETANINKETLEAMKNASKAMKEIHGGLTIDKVDQTMYVLHPEPQPILFLFGIFRAHLELSTLTPVPCAPQGRASRSARHCRGNRRRHHADVGHARRRRRRAGGRTRGHAAGGAGQPDAVDGTPAYQRQGRRPAHGSASRFVSTNTPFPHPFLVYLAS
jgi:hypothetical protein